MQSENITPAKFKCGEASPTCPSIHRNERGEYILIGDYVSHGEIGTMGISRIGDGESAICWPPEFLDAFVRDYVAKNWLGKEE